MRDSHRSRSAEFARLLMLTVATICVSPAASAIQVPSWSLSDLQGSWWSDTDSPTAEFAITREEIWLDYDAGYHPCRIVDADRLVYDLGPDLGGIERRVVSLDGDVLVLEASGPAGSTRTTYRRQSD